VEQNDLLAVLLLGDGFTGPALNQHERGADHLHVAPVGLLHDVGGQAGSQFVVGLPDIGQRAIDLFNGFRIWPRGAKLAVAQATGGPVLFDFLAGGCLPLSIAHHTGTVVP
jgi:hypothetical protein